MCDKSVTMTYVTDTRHCRFWYSIDQDLRLTKWRVFDCEEEVPGPITLAHRVPARPIER